MHVRVMTKGQLAAWLIILLGLGFVAGIAWRPWEQRAAPTATQVVQAPRQIADLIREGQRVFRFETFGDEDFWGGQLQLHLAIAGEQNGGVGPGLSPQAALAVGLKVDAGALPPSLRRDLVNGRVDLTDPAVTLQLLRLNAVVGITGFFSNNRLTSVGIQCALCHSTVDNSLAPGIGARLDGWANRDLNVGAIIALAPNLQPFTDLLGVSESALRNILASWGPGKFDALVFIDGKAFRPDGKSGAVLIPPAFGLAGINLHTWTGFGSVPYWNAYVANVLMHGKGTFYDPRLNNPEQYPIAVRAGLWNVRTQPDLITPRLAALHLYQLSLLAPRPPADSFNPKAAQRGKVIFEGMGQCARCHVPPLYAEPGFHMHLPSEVGVDAFQADRSPEHRYRTPPLKGLWTHQQGGFYHDGRFATLEDVVEHYNELLRLGLDERQQQDLVQYLKSL